jgi:hypothetical protein
MKQIRTRLPSLFVLIILMGISASQPAFAHGGSGRVGIYLGAPVGFNFGYSPYPYFRAPYYGPLFYPPAPVYYPPVQQPPQIIYTERRIDPPISSQRSPTNSVQNVQNSWWYFCAATNTYYPYVNKCPGGWLRVAP